MLSDVTGLCLAVPIQEGVYAGASVFRESEARQSIFRGAIDLSATQQAQQVQLLQISNTPNTND